MGLVNAAIKKLGSIWKEDYVQEGCIGLIKAIRKFKPEYGTQFSTFAMYHITGQIQKYKRDFEIDGVVGIHISRTIKDIYYIIKKHENKTDEEIANDDEIVNNLFKLQQSETQLKETVTAIKKINKELDGLEERDRELLVQWYVEKVDRLDLCSRYNISQSELYRRKDKAIREFAVQVFGIRVIS